MPIVPSHFITKSEESVSNCVQSQTNLIDVLIFSFLSILLIALVILILKENE
jgi:hypothetical protein